MESLTWFLTFAVVVLWIGVGVDLLRRPPGVPRGWWRGARRLFWGLIWAGAGLAGVWGPELWSQSSSDHPPDVAVGAPTQESRTVLRTPFAVQVHTTRRDAESRLVHSERRLSLQLPVALLAFLAGIFVLRRLERRRDPALPHGSAGAGLACLALLMACEPDGPQGADAPRPDRIMVEMAWDTLSQLQTTEEEPILFSAGAVVAGGSGFWVLDRMGHQAAHFDWDSELQWHVGREGGGPGEFTNPRTLALDRDEVLWVLDAGNHRISGFDAAGRLLDEIGLGDLDGVLNTFSVAPEGDRFYGMLFQDHLEPVRIDRDGRVERGARIRIRDAGDSSFGMAFQGMMPPTAAGSRWVHAFSMGDGLYLMEELEPAVERIRYPEWIPFPGVSQEERREGNRTVTTTRMAPPIFAAQNVTIADDRILVRFAGESEHAGRLVDVYDLTTAEYRESFLLPTPGQMAAWDDRFVLVRDDPTPELLVVRPSR
jgi:hypothetical protein